MGRNPEDRGDPNELPEQTPFGLMPGINGNQVSPYRSPQSPHDTRAAGVHSWLGPTIAAVILIVIVILVVTL